MKKMRILAAVLLVTAVLSANLGHAAMPVTLSYQGSLYLHDGTPVDGEKKLTFKLYTDETSGTAFWTEVQNSVTVTKGHYSTILGKTTALNVGSFTGDTWLGITVDTDSEMTPREQLTSVPFAFNGVPHGGIIMWSGSTVPDGWALCDGSNGTPNLQSRFIYGGYSKSGTSISYPNLTGGSPNQTLAKGNLPQHTHTTRFDSYGYESSRQYLNEVLTVPGWDSSHWNTYYTSGTGDDLKSSPDSFSIMPPYYALAFIMKL